MLILPFYYTIFILYFNLTKSNLIPTKIKSPHSKVSKTIQNQTDYIISTSVKLYKKWTYYLLTVGYQKQHKNQLYVTKWLTNYQ